MRGGQRRSKAASGITQRCLFLKSLLAKVGFAPVHIGEWLGKTFKKFSKLFYLLCEALELYLRHIIHDSVKMTAMGKRSGRGVKEEGGRAT